MDSTRKPLRDRFKIPTLVLRIAIGLLIVPAVASAQVRTKKPDRGVYQSPRLPSVIAESPRAESSRAESDESRAGIAEMVRSQAPTETTKRKRRELVEVTLDADTELVPISKNRPTPAEPAASEPATSEPMSSESPISDPEFAPPIIDSGDPLQRVGHEDVVLVQPHRSNVTVQGDVIWNENEVIHDGTCDGCSDCNLNSCDSIGCDSMGTWDAPWYKEWANSFLCLDSEQWFGSAELLLMFRVGDRLPALVTTTVEDPPDAETAGEIGQTDTRVVVGNGTILKDLRAGGRLKLGTWIDNQHCRSLVMRAWFAGEETFGFAANQDQLPVIARPFLNVSDGQAATQDTQLIAFPDRVTGSIEVQANSQVYGGDISVQQFWYGKYGATVDVLYGYQYMRLDENLGISSTSTSLDDDFAPVGSVLSIQDLFETDNEFHGGQLGLSSRYREGCWSFNGLLKFGFGSLRRRAKLNGLTFTSIDGATATDPNGLLVRSTNTGTFTDHTFGWVPELDLSLGWQKYPGFDVTVGYYIIAMTDALQTSGAIDPQLAVNLSDPPTGQQRPSPVLRYDTFYVQGISFGLQYAY